MLVCLVEAISALPLACVVPLPISRLATCLHASLDGLLSMTCHLLVEHCRSTLHPRWIVCDREGFTCFFGYFSLVLSLPRIHRGSRIASVVLVHRPASVAIPSVRHSHPSATWLPHISATWHPHRLDPTQTSRPQGPGEVGRRAWGSSLEDETDRGIQRHLSVEVPCAGEDLEVRTLHGGQFVAAPTVQKATHLRWDERRSKHGR